VSWWGGKKGRTSCSVVGGGKGVFMCTVHRGVHKKREIFKL
jgi:hypothetical protein